MLANFLPKPYEIIEESIRFYEGLVSWGYHATMRIPKSVDLPKYGYEMEASFDGSSISTYISLDPHPKLKLLNDLGWTIEDNSQLPLICYISRYVPADNSKPWDVRDKAIELKPICKTIITLDYDYEDKGKDFTISSISSNSFNPVYYIANLTPYREKMPDVDDPLNDQNINKLRVQSPMKDNFRFMNAGIRPEEVNIKY